MAAITQQEAILRQQFNSIPSTYKINHLADGSANSDNEGKIKLFKGSSKLFISSISVSIASI